VLGDFNVVYGWDWAEAERDFRRSLALDPNNANTHHWYDGDYLLAVDRMDEAGEAIPELRNMVAMDTAFPLTNEYLDTAYVRSSVNHRRHSLWEHCSSDTCQKAGITRTAL